MTRDEIVARLHEILCYFEDRGEDITALQLDINVIENGVSNKEARHCLAVWEKQFNNFTHEKSGKKNKKKT